MTSFPAAIRYPNAKDCIGRAWLPAPRRARDALGRAFHAFHVMQHLLTGAIKSASQDARKRRTNDESIWSAATCRRFPTHTEYHSGDKSPHSKRAVIVQLPDQSGT